MLKGALMVRGVWWVVVLMVCVRDPVLSCLLHGTYRMWSSASLSRRTQFQIPDANLVGRAAAALNPFVGRCLLLAGMGDRGLGARDAEAECVLARSLVTLDWMMPTAEDGWVR